MKQICLYFQIHQPYRLRRYRFFDIGNAHYYNDDYLNEEIFERISHDCYYPANRMIMDLLDTYPDFKVNFILSGLVIEQMEYYAPVLIEQFKKMTDSGRVEFLIEPYAHSVSSLYDITEFKAQCRMHRDKIKELFGVSPKVFCNTELIYSDEIGEAISDIGFEGVLTEGAKHILGWKSPNYIYHSQTSKPLKLLLRNGYISDMIIKDFTQYSSPNYPVTADKILDIIKHLPHAEQFVNLYMNYEVLGVMHNKGTGIFEFFKAIPRLADERHLNFATASELLSLHQPIDKIDVFYPISCSGEEKSVNEWSGNVLQQGAIHKLAEWGERVRAVQDRSILQDWIYLQSADHLYYMNTINNGGGQYSPYSSPYDAFNNYMNVLSDLLIRVEEKCPSTIDTEELNSYQQTIKNQDLKIHKLEKEIEELKGSTPA